MNKITKNLPIILTVVLVFLFSADLAYADMTFMTSIMWGLVTGLFGRIMWIGGALLDWGIQDFVIGFGDGFKNNGIGLAVNTLWVTVRDVFNITFIFGLVYIGLKMILNSGDSGAKRWLVNLILAALLVNFSLFITKFVVDVSNILATQLASGFVDLDGSVNVSQTFMDQLGLQSMLNPDKGYDGNSILNADSTPWGYIFGAAITFLIAGFVFFAGGLLLIIRYGVLCIYMILSPLMFLGWVFPGLQRVSSDYWRGFLGRAFFAPVYILMLYFSATVLKSFATMSTSKGETVQHGNIWTGSGEVSTLDFRTTLPPFILSIVFLVASIVIANKMGANGASGAVSIMNKAKERTQRAVKNTAYRGARTATRAATAPVRYSARSASNRLGQGLDRAISRAQQRGGLVGAAARNTAVASTARNTASRAQNARFGLRNTVAQNVQEANAINSQVQRGRDRTQSQADITANRAAIAQQDQILNNSASTAAQKQAAAAARATAETALRDAQNVMGGAVRQMTNEELAELTAAELQSQDLAVHLSDSQITSLQNSGKFTNDQVNGVGGVGGVRGARDAGLIADTDRVFTNVNATADELNDAFDQLGRNVRGLSNERVEGMGYNRLTDERTAMNLTDGHIEHLQASGRYTTAQISDIRTARDNGLTAVASGNFTNPAGAPGSPSLVNTGNTAAATPAFARDQRERLMSRNVQQAGQLPVSVFTQPDMAAHITPQVLEQRMRNGRVKDSDIDDIRNNLQDHIDRVLMMNPTKQQRVANQWKTWANRSPYGAQLGLDLSAY